MGTAFADDSWWLDIAVLTFFLGAPGLLLATAITVQQLHAARRAGRTLAGHTIFLIFFGSLVGSVAVLFAALGYVSATAAIGVGVAILLATLVLWIGSFLRHPSPPSRPAAVPPTPREQPAAPQTATRPPDPPRPVLAWTDESRAAVNRGLVVANSALALMIFVVGLNSGNHPKGPWTMGAAFVLAASAWVAYVGMQQGTAGAAWAWVACGVIALFAPSVMLSVPIGTFFTSEATQPAARLLGLVSVVLGGALLLPVQGAGTAPTESATSQEPS